MSSTPSRPARRSFAHRSRDHLGDGGPLAAARNRRIERRQARANQRARRAATRLELPFQLTRFVSSTNYPVETPPLATDNHSLTGDGLVASARDGSAAFGGRDTQPVLARTVAALRALNEGINGTPPQRSDADRRATAPLVALNFAARAAKRTADRYGADGQSFMLLTLPILAMLIAFGASESLRPGRRVAEQASVVPKIAAGVPVAASVAVHSNGTAPVAVLAAGPADTVAASLDPATAAQSRHPQLTESTPASQSRIVAVEATPAPLARAELGADPGADDGANPRAAPFDMAALVPTPSVVEDGVLPPSIAVVPSHDVSEPLGDAIPLPGQTVGTAAKATTQCEASPELMLTSAQRADPYRLPPLPPRSEIGPALAAAARSQAQDLVVYDERYRRIAYPMGDVSPFYGVCTDVVIRAYRAIGIDLQYAVQASGMGVDTNVDHRRTETLRRFFLRHGESLPVSTFAEDYRPGDIVTYYRPQNSGSRSHIAVVSDVVAPSGRYMIVHNRGWGPQIEDGLFVDEITGHYRYTGAGPSRPPESLIVARAPAVAPVKSRTTDVAAVAPAPLVQTPAITVTAARAPSAPQTGGKLSRAPQAAEPGRRSFAQGRVTAGRLAESVAAVPTTRLVQRRVSGASEGGIRTDFGLGR